MTSVLIDLGIGWSRADPGMLALLATIGLLLLCTIGFVATAGVLRYRNRRKAMYWRQLERRWELLLMEVLSGAAPPEAIWRCVDQRDRLFFVDYLTRFARRLRGSSREVLAELARPYLGTIVQRMQGGDAERRARAVETVARLAFDEHAEAVMRALDDPSPLVTMVAARNIARSQNPRHMVALLRHLPRLQTWSPRQLSAILVSMGSAVVPHLREMLADRAVPTDTRAVIADALLRLRDIESADIAAEMIRTESDRELVAASLRLLGVLGRPVHVSAIRELCASPDPVLRAQAMNAMASAGADADLACLRTGLEDESSWVAIQAARALREVGSADALIHLIDSRHPRADLARQVLVEQS